jgi:hypothetical protein
MATVENPGTDKEGRLRGTQRPKSQGRASDRFGLKFAVRNFPGE